MSIENLIRLVISKLRGGAYDLYLARYEAVRHHEETMLDLDYFMGANSAALHATSKGALLCASIRQTCLHGCGVKSGCSYCPTHQLNYAQLVVRTRKRQHSKEETHRARLRAPAPRRQAGRSCRHVTRTFTWFAWSSSYSTTPTTSQARNGLILAQSLPARTKGRKQ